MSLLVTGGINQRIQQVPFQTPRQFRIQCCKTFNIPYDQGVLLDRLKNKVISLNENLNIQDYQTFSLGFVSVQELANIYKVQQIQEIQQKDQEMQMMKKDLESQIAQLTQDSSSQLKQKDNIIQQLKRDSDIKIKELTQKLDGEIKNHNLTQENLNSQIKLIKNQKEEEKKNLINQYTKEIQELKQNLQNYVISYEQVTTEYNNIYQICQNQEQKLFQQDQFIAQQNNELENLQEDNTLIQKKLKKKYQELENDFNALNQNFGQLKVELDNSTKLKKQQKEQIKKLKQQIEELQNNALTQNNNNVNYYQEENNQLKKKNQELKIELQKFQQNQTKIELTEKQIQNKNKQILDLESTSNEQIKKYQEQINDLKQKLKMANEQNTGFIVKIKSHEQSVQQLDKTNKEKEIKIQTLQNELLNQLNISEELKSGKDLQQQDLQHEMKNNELSKQKIESLEGQVEKEQMEIKQLQQNINERIEQIRKLQYANEDLKKQLQQLDQLKQLQQEKTILNNKFTGLSERIQQTIYGVDKYIKSLIPILHTRLNGIKISEFQNYKKELLNENQQFKFYKVNCDFNKLNECIINGQFYKAYLSCLKAQELGTYQTQYYPIKLSENDLQEAYLMRPTKILDAIENGLINKTFYIKHNKKIDTFYNSADSATQLTINNFLCQFYLNQFIQELKLLKINLPCDIQMGTQYLVQDLETNRFYHTEIIQDQPLTLHFRDFQQPFNKTNLSEFLVAFSYYTYWKSSEFLMISYLQTSNNIIYDPYVCTKDGICSQVDLGIIEISKLKDFIEQDLIKGGVYMKVIEKIRK